NVREVLRRRTVADHLVRGSVDKRAVQYTVAGPGQGNALLLQELCWKDVVVIDALIDHQLASDDGLRIEIPCATACTEDQPDRSAVDRALPWGDVAQCLRIEAESRDGLRQRSTTQPGSQLDDILG